MNLLLNNRITTCDRQWNPPPPWDHCREVHRNNTCGYSKRESVSCSVIIRCYLHAASPWIIAGSAQASSVGSMAFCTSPLASLMFFPSSFAQRTANSSLCAYKISLHLNMYYCLFASDNLDHAGNAACAEAIASSTSSAVQHGTRAITSPVLESVTSMYFSDFDSFHSPFTQ